MSIGAIKAGGTDNEYRDIIRAGHYLYDFYYFKTAPDEYAVKVLARTAALVLPPEVTATRGQGSRLQKWELERYYELATRALADYQIEQHGYLRDNTPKEIDRAMQAISRLLMDVVGAVQGSARKLEHLNPRDIDQAVSVLLSIAEAIHSSDVYVGGEAEEYGPSNIAVATL